MQIVAVVGGYERNTSFFRKANQVRVYTLLDVETLVLNFEKEISLPENVAQPVSVLSRLLVFLLHYGFCDCATKTGGKGNQSFAVFRKQVVVDAWLVVKAFEKT